MKQIQSHDDKPPIITKLSFLCIGAGAIGTYIGGSLAASGHKVVFLEQATIAEEIRGTGLRINSGTGTTKVDQPIVVATLPEAFSLGPFDAGIFALKSFDTESVIRQFLPHQIQIPTILCLQNGVENEFLIEKMLGHGKAIAGTVTSAIARHKPGVITVEKLRGTGIADHHPLSRKLFLAFSEANLQPQLFSDAASMKWSKLLTNLLSNASSAILDMPPAMVFANPRLFEIEREQLRETLRIMKALGIKPVNLPKTPVLPLVFAVQHLPMGISHWLIQRAVGKGRGQKMPSFHIDLHNDRGKSEVDYLNGAVVRFGKRVGVETPINSRLTSILLALTEKKLPLSAYAHDPDKFYKALIQDRDFP